MSLVVEYQKARRQEDVARLRRALALRGMVATGSSQREIAVALGISQPAVSQQLKSASTAADVHPETLLAAAAPILVDTALSRGFARLAVFGSVARQEARADSDIDLLVEPPTGAGIKELVELRRVFEEILGRQVDLVTYGGLKPKVDDDIQAEAVPL